MAEFDVTLPSGLRGVMRGLKVKEQNMLADQREHKVGDAPYRVLGSVWLRTLDTGPYEGLEGARRAINDDGTIDWHRVLLGDHFSAFMQCMSASFPGKYEFDVPCQRCAKTVKWQVDPRELPTRALPRESFEQFKTDNRFTTMIAGAEVAFRLQTADIQERMEAAVARSPDERASMSFMMQLISVSGVDARNIREWVLDLDAADSMALRSAMDAADCGVVTRIDVQCQACGRQQEVDIPFGRDFFSGKRV